MQVYNEMAVIEVSPDIGQLSVCWFDNTRDGQGKLVTPIKDQYVIFRSHKIPIEAEVNNWTRDQLRDFWLNEVEDVADIPQWAQDEIGMVTIEQPIRVRVNAAPADLPF